MHESAIAGSNPVDASEREQLAFTVKQAAKALAMGERKLWQLVKAEQTTPGAGIRSYTVGTSRRISRTALLDFIEQQEKAA